LCKVFAFQNNNAVYPDKFNYRRL